MRSTEITKALQESVKISGSQVGFKSKDVSAQSMRERGGMHLILVRVDTDTIRPVGGIDEQHNPPLPPYICTELHNRSGDTHGPTWGLCNHPAIPRWLTTLFPKSGPLIDLLWGQVGGLK